MAGGSECFPLCKAGKARGQRSPNLLFICQRFYAVYQRQQSSCKGALWRALRRDKEETFRCEKDFLRFPILSDQHLALRITAEIRLPIAVGSRPVVI